MHMRWIVVFHINTEIILTLKQFSCYIFYQMNRVLLISPIPITEVQEKESFYSLLLLFLLIVFSLES